jgi:hypothetical protein
LQAALEKVFVGEHRECGCPALLVFAGKFRGVEIFDQDAFAGGSFLDFGNDGGTPGSERGGEVAEVFPGFGNTAQFGSWHGGITEFLALAGNNAGKDIWRCGGQFPMLSRAIALQCNTRGIYEAPRRCRCLPERCKCARAWRRRSASGCKQSSMPRNFGCWQLSGLSMRPIFTDEFDPCLRRLSGLIKSGVCSDCLAIIGSSMPVHRAACGLLRLRFQGPCWSTMKNTDDHVFVVSG